MDCGNTGHIETHCSYMVLDRTCNSCSVFQYGEVFRESTGPPHKSMLKSNTRDSAIAVEQGSGVVKSHTPYRAAVYFLG